MVYKDADKKFLIAYAGFAVWHKYSSLQINSGSSKNRNNLFPVFLKLEELRLLIIGGGNVGLEKLNAVVKNSPGTPVTMVATRFNPETISEAKKHTNISLAERPYALNDFDNIDIVIAAVNDVVLSEQICNDAHAKGKLVNIADKPDLCDFYLSSVVTKGNIKIAISTNGKSPTIAKRLRDAINDFIPDETDDMLDNIHTLRKNMKGDFAEKVRQLNELTQTLVTKNASPGELLEIGKNKTKYIKWLLFALVFIAIGYLLAKVTG